MTPATTLRLACAATTCAFLATTAACASQAIAPPSPESVPVPVEPELPTLQERRAEPFAVLSSGQVVPYRTVPVAHRRNDDRTPPSSARSDDAAPAEMPVPAHDVNRQTGRTDEERTVARAHQVVSGDTLWNIARRYGVSMDAIREANGMGDDTVRIGQLLLIPAAS